MQLFPYGLCFISNTWKILIIASLRKDEWITLTYIKLINIINKTFEIYKSKQWIKMELYYLSWQ